MQTSTMGGTKVRPNGRRISCGALKKNQIPLRALAASCACYAATHSDLASLRPQLQYEDPKNDKTQPKSQKAAPRSVKRLALRSVVSLRLEETQPNERRRSLGYPEAPKPVPEKRAHESKHYSRPDGCPTDNRSHGCGLMSPELRPNGSRLRCGRSARGSTGDLPDSVTRLAHKPNSTLPGGARQLQALVRPRALWRFPLKIQLAARRRAIAQVEIDQRLVRNPTGR